MAISRELFNFNEELVAGPYQYFSQGFIKM